MRHCAVSLQTTEYIYCLISPLSSQETEHMVKKQADSKEEHCVNPSVFQEYITAARLVNWQALAPLFRAWLFTITVIYATE